MTVYYCARCNNMYTFAHACGMSPSPQQIGKPDAATPSINTRQARLEIHRSDSDDVREFHEKFELGIGKEPTLPESSWLLGRVEMFLEEIMETCRAARNNDLAGVADGLVDLAYFVHGTAIHLGIPWDEVWAEVHSANMRKVAQPSSEEGRRKNKLDVIKPEGWQPPDVAGILRRETLRTRIPIPPPIPDNVA